MKPPLPALLAFTALLASCSQNQTYTLPQHQVKANPPAAQPEATAQPEASAQPEPQPELPVEVDTQGVNPLNLTGKKAEGYTNPYPKGSYEHFVAQPAYPITSQTYKNAALLNRVTAANSKIIVCLPQQRARLYVDGKVAYDWPVSTGRDGHETPTGAFRILEKQPDHKSNRYGKFINNKGRVVNSNADTAKGVPDNYTFRPASMPHWNRFTWDGVGLHGGKVIPGKRLSHGCIRTPYKVAADLYDYTVLGMPAYITRAVEDYNRGGAVKPIDVKYRPGGDYTDMAQPAKKP